MNCKECQNLFSDHVDKRLPQTESVRVNEHLQNCRICTEELRALQLIVSNAADLEKRTAPEYLWDRIEAELDATRNGFFGRVSNFSFSLKGLFHNHGKLPVLAMRFALAAALVLVGILIGRNFLPMPANNPQLKFAGQPEIGFQALNTRAEKYLESSKILLLGITNLEAGDEKIDLGAEKKLSKKLLHEASFLKENLPIGKNEPIRRLVAELELILLEIANLELQTDFENIELLKSGIDQTNLLLKINLNGLNEELLVPATKSDGSQL